MIMVVDEIALSVVSAVFPDVDMTPVVVSESDGAVTDAGADSIVVGTVLEDVDTSSALTNVEKTVSELCTVVAVASEPLVLSMLATGVASLTFVDAEMVESSSINLAAIQSWLRADLCMVLKR
jgi:hypothetical protein